MDRIVTADSGSRRLGFNANVREFKEWPRIGGHSCNLRVFFSIRVSMDHLVPRGALPKFPITLGSLSLKSGNNLWHPESVVLVNFQRDPCLPYFVLLAALVGLFP